MRSEACMRKDKQMLPIAFLCLPAPHKSQWHPNCIPEISFSHCTYHIASYQSHHLQTRITAQHLPIPITKNYKLLLQQPVYSLNLYPLLLTREEHFLPLQQGWQLNTQVYFFLGFSRPSSHLWLSPTPVLSHFCNLNSNTEKECYDWTFPYQHFYVVHVWKLFAKYLLACLERGLFYVPEYVLWGPICARLICNVSRLVPEREEQERLLWLMTVCSHPCCPLQEFLNWLFLSVLANSEPQISS